MTFGTAKQPNIYTYINMSGDKIITNQDIDVCNMKMTKVPQS